MCTYTKPPSQPQPPPRELGKNTGPKFHPDQWVICGQCGAEYFVFDPVNIGKIICGCTLMPVRKMWKE